MIPVDEMLTDLRAVLERFDADPSDQNFAAIQREARRIQNTCEDSMEPI